MILQKFKNMSEVAKATLCFFICSVIQKSLSLITTPIFTRLLTTEQMGQVTSYNTWLQIFTIITTLRLDYGVFNKGMSKFPDNRKDYTSSMLGTTSVITVVMFGIYWCFREPVNELTELSTLFVCLIFLELFFIPAMSFWSLYQRYSYRYKSVVAVTLSLSVCNTLFSILAVFVSEEKGTARIVAGAVIQVIFGMALFVVCFCRSKKFFKWTYISYALKFNIPLLPHYFSTYILEQSDKIMIQKMVGKGEMGIYGVACSIAQVIKIISSSITNALVPWEYETLKRKNYKEVGKRITAVVAVVEVLIAIFICFAPEVMFIMAPASYREALSIIPPISSSVFIILYFSLVVNIEFYFEKNKFVMYISCISAVINIVINYIGIKCFGYVAAAYATLICYIISGICHMFYANNLVREVSGENILSKFGYFAISGSAILWVVLMTFLYDYLWLRYLVIVVLGSILVINRKKIVVLVSKKRN